MRKNINPKIIRPETAIYYLHLRLRLRKMITSIPIPSSDKPKQPTQPKKVDNGKKICLAYSPYFNHTSAWLRPG